MGKRGFLESVSTAFVEDWRNVETGTEIKLRLNQFVFNQSTKWLKFPPFWAAFNIFFLALLQVGSALVESNLNDDLDYDPQVAISCDKVTRHVDVNTGDWIADKNSTRLCTTDKTKVLE